jgi:hypothetical protein
MNMWEEFEEFTQGASSSRGGNVPRISLNNRGDMTLNQLAFDKLQKAKKVVLGFNKQKGLIGIRTAREDENHALEVKSLAKSTSYIIRSKAFCNFYNIIPKQTIVFDEITSDEIGLILDLTKVTVLAPRVRHKKPVEQPKLVEPVKPVEPAKPTESNSSFAWVKT